MSSISNIGNYNLTSSYSGLSGTQRHQRPSAEEMASDLFSKLDTSSKGYIQQSDLRNGAFRRNVEQFWYQHLQHKQQHGQCQRNLLPTRYQRRRQGHQGRDDKRLQENRRGTR